MLEFIGLEIKGIGLNWWHFFDTLLWHSYHYSTGAFMRCPGTEPGCYSILPLTSQKKCCYLAPSIRVEAISFNIKVFGQTQTQHLLIHKTVLYTWAFGVHLKEIFPLYIIAFLFLWKISSISFKSKKWIILTNEIISCFIYVETSTTMRCPVTPWIFMYWYIIIYV